MTTYVRHLDVRLGGDPSQTIVVRVGQTIKDTQREKAPSNKTPAVTKSTDMAV